jgi:hypothetical protein
MSCFHRERTKLPPDFLKLQIQHETGAASIAIPPDALFKRRINAFWFCSLLVGASNKTFLEALNEG